MKDLGLQSFHGGTCMGSWNVFGARGPGGSGGEGTHKWQLCNGCYMHDQRQKGVACFCKRGPVAFKLQPQVLFLVLRAEGGGGGGEAVQGGVHEL